MGILTVAACVMTVGMAGLEAAVPHPEGELAARIALVFDRITVVEEPAFSDDFILADVVVDKSRPRRFMEFSGDISGRFLGALAMLSRGAEDDTRLHRLVAETLKHQRKDGRFGYENLSFKAADVGPDQMALLWGNGRLLVGLLEYAQRFPERKEALEAAERLGVFLLAVFDDCAKPEVMDRLRGKAANGFICFTQLNEGLELLARATGKEAYRDAARKMEPILEGRGDQHTHGYLTTLRGAMMIYETTGDTAVLEAVKKRYQDLLDSGSVMLNGGILEYFKPDYDRDEGCSVADLLRLSLQLWKATGDEAYLERAETCLYNAFYANQFDTGDFGHRCFAYKGYKPHPGSGRAWWCCTMHGMRAFRDVLDSVVTADKGGDALRLNLWEEGRWSAGGCTLAVSRKARENGAGASYEVTLEDGPAAGVRVLLRRPAWAAGFAVSPAPAGGETALLLKPGDRVTVSLEYAFRFVNPKNEAVAYEALPADKPELLALFLGPWLLGVDERRNPMFHGEPWDENVLLFPDEGALRAAAGELEGEGVASSGPVLGITYNHSGFMGEYAVPLTPVASQTAHDQATFSYRHLVQRAP